jgi:hypothetical protein
MPRHDAWTALFVVLTLIYLVLPFGWSGSPGRFGVLALLPEIITQSVAPAEPRLNGGEPLDSKTHVDDATRAEVKIGYRPWLSAREYDTHACEIFGANAIHEKKRALEGRAVTTSIWWGYIMRVLKVGAVLSIPEVKLEKVSHLVYLEQFDWGNRRLPRLEIQVVRGLGTFVGNVCKGVRPEMASFDRALSRSDQDEEFLFPVGSETEIDEVWCGIWFTIEFLRILIHNRAAWEMRFSAFATAVLRPEQRIALPGESEKTGWQGGDSTPEVCAHLDWKDKTLVREQMQDGLYQALAALFPNSPVLVIISVGELMTYVCTATTQGAKWKGQTKWYCSDNKNVVGWIRDRYSTNQLVQYLLRILGLAESLHEFDSCSCYVRTYHNLVPDGLTREEWKEYRSDLLAQGFKEVPIAEAWKFYMREMQRQHEANLGALVAYGVGGEDRTPAR